MNLGANYSVAQRKTSLLKPHYLGFVVTRPVSAVHGKKIEHTFIWDSKYEQSMDSNRLQTMTLEARCTKTKGKKPRRKTVRSGD
jgi:hypothetical protein